MIITKPSIPPPQSTPQKSPTLPDPVQPSTDFQYLLTLNDLLHYFNSIKITPLSQKKSDLYTNQKLIAVTRQIYNNQTQINPTSLNIDSLLVKEKISQQQEKATQLKTKKSQILHQLALLDTQLSRKRQSHSKGKINLSMDASRISSKDNEEDQDQITKKLIFSKQQHKQLVLKIVKERQERQKTRLLLKQKQEQKLKKLQEQQSQLEAKKIQDQKRKKAQEIEEKLKKKRQMHEKFLEQEKQSQRKVHEIKNKKFLYQEISQKFELKVRMPFLEQQKKVLRQKRQFAKAYSIDQIKNHQKAYLQLRENSMKKSQAKDISKPSTDYKMPIKSSRLQKILQDQQLEQRKKLMQKKRAIQEKLQRQENYVDYLKENFSKIKIDKTKQEEIKKRIQKLSVKRQEIDSRAIGMGYLEEAKKLRKKTAQPAHETEKEEAVNENEKNITVLSEPKKSGSESRVEEVRRNNLMKKRQEKIQILIHDSTLNETERIKKLKMETEKINEAFRMKEEMLKYGYSEKVEEEAVELLLTSIQAKMGIIDITKERDANEE